MDDSFRSISRNYFTSEEKKRGSRKKIRRTWSGASRDLDRMKSRRLTLALFSQVFPSFSLHSMRHPEALPLVSQLLPYQVQTTTVQYHYCTPFGLALQTANKWTFNISNFHSHPTFQLSWVAVGSMEANFRFGFHHQPYFFQSSAFALKYNHDSREDGKPLLCS